MVTDWSHDVTKQNQKARIDEIEKRENPRATGGFLNSVKHVGPLVAHRGFEPLVSSLRGRCPRPLDECAKHPREGHDRIAERRQCCQRTTGYLRLNCWLNEKTW